MRWAWEQTFVNGITASGRYNHEGRQELMEI